MIFHMPTAYIGSSAERLVLVPEPSVGAPDTVIATLELDGLTATASVVSNYASGFEDLASYFQSLVDNWRGWSDVRTWESLEHDLRLDARHEHSRVQLTVTVRRDRADWGNDGWRVVGDLSLEPGEELSQIARDVAALAAG